jgi:hypothetical protein
MNRNRKKGQAKTQGEQKHAKTRRNKNRQRPGGGLMPYNKYIYFFS